ncbi:MAG: hypothetical protein KatS3mg091_557 [Patescibacteria group bacterium]|nr:MAG: hypothetical protein KatS3mg091_557 [Patescibacteria group bacterium]
MNEGESFLSQLLKKLSDVRRIEEKTGRSIKAAQQEVLRQIGQTSPKRGGNPITGEGVTKSGKED